MGHTTAGALRCLVPALLLALAAAAAHPHPHGAAPVSPIAGGQGGGTSDLDLFADVAAWQDLDFYRLFFFTGGGRGAHSGHIQGGMAAALYPFYVAAFFNGDLFSGSGGAADRENPAWEETADQTNSKTVWNDELVLFLGSDLLGGFRFNLLFNGMEFVSQTEKDGMVYDYQAPFHTSLQWGRRFGSFSAGITAGIGWGGHERWSETWETDAEDTAAETGVATTTIRNYTTAGIKLEAAYGSFAADYQISLYLGREETLSGASSGNGTERIGLGPVEHLANLYYNTAMPIAEGMSLSLRPALQLRLYHSDYEAAQEGDAYETLRSFSFSPMLDAELGWQITEKVFIATSLSLNVLTARFERLDSGSYWQVTGLAVDSDASGSLDFRFAFSKSFVLEAGIDSLFDFSGERYVLDLANLNGAFALIFKPGM